MAANVKLLVVEDEPSIRELIETYLVPLGYDVETAGSGGEALEKLRDSDFDAIVADIKMPGLSGIDLHASLQQQSAGLARKIIFITGDMITPETRTFLSECGCEWISKPFDLTNLLEKIRKATAAC